MLTSCFSCDLPEETWRSTVKSKHIRTPSCTLIPKSILGSLARNYVAQKKFLLNNKLRDTFSVKSACLGHSLLSPFTAAPQLFSMKELRLLTGTLASRCHVGIEAEASKLIWVVAACFMALIWAALPTPQLENVPRMLEINWIPSHRIFTRAVARTAFLNPHNGWPRIFMIESSTATKSFS